MSAGCRHKVLILMRLWSIHPQYLDSKGLVALWREGLLAQKVLSGETRGYRNHPQLTRFRGVPNPLGAIASYLRSVADEAEKRGYQFSRDKILKRRLRSRIAVTDGQVEYEFRHLLSKLRTRDPDLYRRLKDVRNIRLHPLFKRKKGGTETWEVIHDN